MKYARATDDRYVVLHYGNHHDYYEDNDNKYEFERVYFSYDENEIWTCDSHLHRVFGPARIYRGVSTWWIDGVRICSHNEFKSKAGLTDEEMTIMVLKYGPIQ